MDELKRVTVILGAGASFDVHNGSVPIIRPEMRPPLAKQLFEARFWGIAQSYIGVKVLGAELGRLAQLEELPFDLEERLSQYASSEDALTRRHFRDIPPYLRDLLMRVTDEYVPSPTNYLNLARRLLQTGSHRICFLTLNYDTLLEKALQDYDGSLKVRGLGDYVAEDRRAWVVKIHGSTNWAIRVPDTSTEEGGHNIDEILGHWDPRDDKGPITLDNRHDESTRWRDEKSGARYYPALSAPLREKTFTCPASHTESLVEFLQGCHKFLIIGASGLDEDLLRFLAKNVPKRETLVQYVNYDLEATLAVRERFEERIPELRGWRRRSAQPGLAHKGFTAYLDGRDLERLIEAE